jgi:hypothetical protein
MKPADNIQKFFKNAGINTNPEMDKTVFDRMLTAQKSQNSDSAVTKSNIRRIIMRSPVTKIAAAAIIFIAAGIGIYTFTQSNKIHYSEVAPHPEVLTGPLNHTFPDDSVVNLADGATIETSSAGGTRGFRHISGAIEVTVNKGQGDFIITTPYGEVKALGTKFSLELVDGTDTNTREEIKLLAVEVEEGSVRVSNAKGSSTLKASRTLVVEPDQKPYDYYQDQNLPLRLRERINAAVEAMEAGDSKAYIANYNVNYMYKLIKGQVEYDPNLFGGSKEDAERLQNMGQDINSPKELIDFFIAMGGIKAQNKLYIRSVDLNETGDHAVVSCVERKGPRLTTITTPQWHYFDNDWWQIDD